MNEHALNVKDLKLRYSNGYMALDRITFTVEHGDIVGYLGPNGAGKTTTIKILTNLLAPTRGRAFINGINVNRHPKRALASVGALIEVPGIYEYLTPHDVLTYFGKVHRMEKRSIGPRITEVLELLKIGDWEYEKLESFSTGMQRRFSIAKAILHEPDILILDEPVIGLDPKGIKQIRDLMKQFQREGMSILISSHLLSEVAETCNKVIFLDKGKIVEQDSVGNIMRSADRKLIEVRLLEGISEKGIDRISAIPLVEAVERSNGGIRIGYDGEPGSSARILSGLLDSGFEVVSYHASEASLEDVYLSIMDDEKGVK